MSARRNPRWVRVPGDRPDLSSLPDGAHRGRGDNRARIGVRHDVCFTVCAASESSASSARQAGRRMLANELYELLGPPWLRAAAKRIRR